MTQEGKELLLKDMCGRLPYGLIVQISLFRDDRIKRDIDLDPHVTENIWEIIDKYHGLPYLRPMSGMTEEERKEYYTFQYKFTLQAHGCQELHKETFSEYLDWLNRNMLDYRGLIEKGLALEAPEGMYN